MLNRTRTRSAETTEFALVSIAKGLAITTALCVVTTSISSYHSRMKSHRGLVGNEANEPNEEKENSMKTVFVETFDGLEAVRVEAKKTKVDVGDYTFVDTDEQVKKRDEDQKRKQVGVKKMLEFEVIKFLTSGSTGFFSGNCKHRLMQIRSGFKLRTFDDMNKPILKYGKGGIDVKEVTTVKVRIDEMKKETNNFWREARKALGGDDEVVRRIATGFDEDVQRVETEFGGDNEYRHRYGTKITVRGDLYKFDNPGPGCTPKGETTLDFYPIDFADNDATDKLVEELKQRFNIKDEPDQK